MLQHAQVVLDTAQGLINGDRQIAYGHPSVNFQRIATIWEQTTGYKFTPRQVAIMMIGLKLAREAQGPKQDSLIDIAAYAALAEEVTHGSN